MFHIAKMMHTKQYANILVCLLILLTKGKISGIAFDGKTSLFLLFLKKEIINRDFIGQSINHITYFENQTAAISAIRADTGCQPTYERCEFKIKLKKNVARLQFHFQNRKHPRKLQRQTTPCKAFISFAEANTKKERNCAAHPLTCEAGRRPSDCSMHGCLWTWLTAFYDVTDNGSQITSEAHRKILSALSRIIKEYTRKKRWEMWAKSILII